MELGSSTKSSIVCGPEFVDTLDGSEAAHNASGQMAKFDAGFVLFFFLLFGSSKLQAVDNMLLAHFERYYDNFMANHFVYNFTAPRPRHAQIKTAMWAVHKMLRMIIDFTWQIIGCECQFG